MARKANQRLKILYLRQMLLDETDDEHGLSMADIISRLAELGIPAERKALYRDLDALRDFGMDIIKRSNAQSGLTEYAVGSRDFELPELLLLVDAVQNSRFLTERKSLALVDHIRSLASKYQAEELAGRVHVEGRIKMQNESIYYNVDDIQHAIAKRRRIAFRYLGYDIDKKTILRKGGKFYYENPVCLVYRDGFYYLITFNDKHDSFVKYRVDRMRNIKICDELATRNDRIATFDVNEYVSQSFGMYDGKSRTLDIRIDFSLIGSFIDRFGKDVSITHDDQGEIRAHVHVLVGPMFYGWLSRYGTMVKIQSPQDVAQEYVDYLQAIMSQYQQGS